MERLNKDIIPKRKVYMNTKPGLASARTSTTIQILFTAIGAVGIPAIILPFAYNYSPLAAAGNFDMSLWRLSWPFFLPLLITTAIVRWFFLKKQSQKEIIASYIVGAVILSVTFSGYIANYKWSDDAQSQLAFISPIVILSLGTFIAE